LSRAPDNILFLEVDDTGVLRRRLAAAVSTSPFALIRASRRTSCPGIGGSIMLAKMASNMSVSCSLFSDILKCNQRWKEGVITLSRVTSVQNFYIPTIVWSFLGFHYSEAHK